MAHLPEGPGEDTRLANPSVNDYTKLIRSLFYVNAKLSRPRGRHPTWIKKSNPEAENPGGVP